MGIRYYAYAFDSDVTEFALADPRAFIGADPLADAWGLEPGAAVSWTNFKQSLPERDLLYLDKTWRNLQVLTCPSSPDDAARPAFRMFEGQVRDADDGMGWYPWVRALPPEEVAVIADDLETIADVDIAVALSDHYSRRGDVSDEITYTTEYFTRAKRYVRALASDGRGFAYMIG